ncbi:ribonuclease H-like domain-containing protein [Tanacetum coccineum]
MVRSMWLFKHKFHADGTLSHYKARLVANGSSQQLGVDFDETFSPVVKPATIRTVLSLAVSRKWLIHHLDVKNAFLNGDLSENVYMHQPPDFIDARSPNHVCRLQRSLYGLKQAPRAWFQCFTGYATRAGFYHSRCDSSLFIYRQGSQVAYLLLYVDDIFLTTSSTTLLQHLIDSLHREFDMTELYFLGISVVRHSTVDTDSKLGPDGVPVQDPTLYRSLARGLQYLMFTRPDLSYAVQQICLYMHDPREPHLAALKRILQYVQGNNLLSWFAKRQHTLSRSRAEGEYQGVANVVAETAWLRNLLRELHSPLSTATLVYYDNVKNESRKSLSSTTQTMQLVSTLLPQKAGQSEYVWSSVEILFKEFLCKTAMMGALTELHGDKDEKSYEVEEDSGNRRANVVETVIDKDEDELVSPDSGSKSNVSENMDKLVISSYAKILNQKLDNKLTRIPTVISDNGVEVVIFDDEIIKEGGKKWDLTVCGYFVGYKMSYQELRCNIFWM